MAKTLHRVELKILEELGNRIQRAREKMKIDGEPVSQAKLGELCSVDGSSIDGRKIRAIENHERDFMFTTVVRVARVAGLSLSWMKVNEAEAIVVARSEAPLMAMLQALIATEDVEALKVVEQVLTLALKSHREASRAKTGGRRSTDRQQTLKEA